MRDPIGAIVQGAIIVAFLAPFAWWLSLRRKQPPATRLKADYDELRRND